MDAIEEHRKPRIAPNRIESWIPTQVDERRVALLARGIDPYPSE
jgi:hypothetical protein